jgi:hypothetical protein
MKFSMKLLSWVSLLIFACGFLCAWLVKPVNDDPEPEEAAAVSDSPRPRATTALRREASGRKRAEARLDRLLEAGGTWQPESAEDYRGLVTALQRRAGFGGLDSKGERLLRSIVTSWYDSEPNAALNWVLTLGNQADESALMSAIVDRCAKDDWQAAVALAEQYGAADGRSIYMPRRLALEVMRTLSPDEFVRIDRMFSGTDPSSPSGMIEVGDDFQFSETLDLYGADKKPQVLLEEWARRDFGAAWEWASERDEPQFNNDSSLRAMAGIWARSAADDELAGFGAYLVGEAGPTDAPDRNLEIAWRLLRERPASGVLQSVLAQAPGDRQDNLNNLLRIGSSGFKAGKENQMVREELLTQMSTEERLAAFETVRSDILLGVRDFGQILTQLGHSPDEIKRMLSE